MKEQKESMTALEALRTFFGEQRPVAVEELKALSKDERNELGREAARLMGVAIETPVSSSAGTEERQRLPVPSTDGKRAS